MGDKISGANILFISANQYGKGGERAGLPGGVLGAGAAAVLRLRLSTTCKDVELGVCTRHTIAHCKSKLHAQESIEPWRQRWFYGGKLLSDRLLVEEARVTPGYVVQVIVSEPPSPPGQTAQPIPPTS